MKARIAALFAATLIGGCAGDNTQSLVILQNGVPEASGGVCISPAGETATFRSSGTLDRAFFTSYSGYPGPSAGYLLFPAVKNNLGASVSGSQVNVDDTAFNIEITRVDVRLEDAVTGASLAPRFSVPQYKVLEANDVVGLAVDVVPAGLVPSLGDGQLVLAKVEVVGNRDGGEIRSNTMEYAIAVCDGCLFYNAGACADFSGSASVNQCNIAQDEVAVCCEHSTRGVICPAAVEAVPAG